MTIIIRCDSSNSIGGGHVKRCITLGQELKFRNQKVIFFTTNAKGNLNNEINKSFELIVIDPYRKDKINNLVDLKNIDTKEYQRLDAKLCLNAIIKRKINLINAIILDSYTLGNEWIKQLKNLSALNLINIERTLYINDFNANGSGFDFELNQNQLEIKKEENRFLHGLKYILLEKCYTKKTFYVTEKKIQHIMLFIGTSDTKNIIPLFLEIFKDDYFKIFNINVVLSEVSLNHKKIKNLISKLSNVNLYSNLPNLNDLIKKSDFIIGAGGTNTWERIYYNKPSLVIKTADNQEIVIKALKEKNAAFIQKELPTPNNLEDLQKNLKDLLENKKVIHKIAKNSITLVDGFGRSRVAFKLLGLTSKLFLKYASLEDALLLFNWYKDYETRSNSLSKNIVSFKQHINWFENQLNSESSLIFILLDSFNTPLGYIRFEKSKIKVNEVYISYGLDYLARGLGISRQLIELGLLKAKKYWESKLIFKGSIKNTNIPSIKNFEKLGFQKIKSNNKNKEYSDYYLKCQ